MSSTVTIMIKQMVSQYESTLGFCLVFYSRRLSGKLWCRRYAKLDVSPLDTFSGNSWNPADFWRFRIWNIVGYVVSSFVLIHFLHSPVVFIQFIPCHGTASLFASRPSLRGIRYPSSHSNASRPECTTCYTPDPRPYVNPHHISTNTLTIVSLPVAGYSETNFWPQSIKLDNQTLDRVYVWHSEIENGATLEWEMGSAPSQWDKDFRWASYIIDDLLSADFFGLVYLALRLVSPPGDCDMHDAHQDSRALHQTNHTFEVTVYSAPVLSNWRSVHSFRSSRYAH
jgi:hypothetical protein